ncbi:MAG: hypothetical protein M3Z21_16430 [Pseudomonadota bacterium]|nr:hypothetical protein [Pseudomonadota bacterium]
MTLFLGVDPGISGALAVLDADGALVDHLHMPIIQGGKRARVNAAALAQFLAGFQGQRLTAYVERVGAMPGQGSASMFSFGHSAGVLEGVLAALEIPLELVVPAAWKRHHGLIGRPKDAARARAVHLYPAAPLHRKRDAGLADAILIGRYGLERAGR